MKTFKINLIEIGRNKTCREFACNFKEEQTAIAFGVDEASKHLMSSEVSAVYDEKTKLWDVYAGFRCVGKIKIEEIK